MNEGHMLTLLEYKAINELILRKNGGMVFRFDSEADELVYVLVDKNGEICSRRISPFMERWLECVRVSATEMKGLLKGKGEKQGVIEFTSKYLEDVYHSYRMDYQYLNDAHTKAIGYMECLDDELGSVFLNNFFVLPQSAELARKLVENYLSEIKSGEKGVLFILEISGEGISEEEISREGLVGLMNIAESIRADFRDRDVFARISPMEFVGFFKGSLSIDIIEKRLERLLNFFVHSQHGADLYKCSIGAVTTVKSTESYDELLRKGRIAIESARKRGKNRYRMYGAD